MSNHIYQTEGLILGSTPVGEANKLFFILTEEFGFIVAVAQGIRELKSKLRYSLQDLSYGRIDLVRGKEIWRITNAEPVNGYHKILSDSDKTRFITRILSLLRRLLHGEEQNQDLYNTLKSIFSFLEKEECSTEDLSNLEIMSNLKILYHLGYFEGSGMFSTIIAMPPSRDVFELVVPIRKHALAEINESLRESHL